jgi:hypothetical protein
MTKCIAIKTHISGTENLLTRNNPILAYHSQPNLHLIEQNIELLLKPGPMISEQTLVFLISVYKRHLNYMTH